MAEIRVLAPAKINLSLDILGKLPDGYHEIKTVYQEISMADAIILRDYEEGEGRLFVNNLEIPYKDNLALIAYNVLTEELDHHKGLDIIMAKKIPLGAGLGGGSSDAAAVLLGLNELWDLNLSQDQLKDISAKLGMDVPFFIMGGTALGKNKGEEISQIESNLKAWVLVVVPPFQINTKRAYELSDGERMGKNIKLTNKLIKKLTSDKISPSEIEEYLHNDFEQFIYRRYPKVNLLKGDMIRAGASQSHLSGSGSAMFSLFSTKKEAEEIGKKLEDKYQVFICKLNG